MVFCRADPIDARSPTNAIGSFYDARVAIGCGYDTPADFLHGCVPPEGKMRGMERLVSGEFM